MKKSNDLNKFKGKETPTSKEETMNHNEGTMNHNTETKKIINGTEKELEEELKSDKIEIKLSEPDEQSPKIRSYTIENSNFPNKRGTCLTIRTKTYTIQDLVTITTSSYCSPDGRSCAYCIKDIDYFPKTESQPEEYDNTTCDEYGHGHYDYLSYDEKNENIFQYDEYNSLGKSITHYFWISRDDKAIIPEIETVKPCNGGFFHHITIDLNKGNYHEPRKETIQETVQDLYNQTKEKREFGEYREKHGEIGLELSWTEYSSGCYKPIVYMGNEHGTLQHEHSNERWYTNTLLVKFGKPGDTINFYRLGQWYTISIDEKNFVDINNHTRSSRCNNQHWRYDELYHSNIQPGQIFINGQDVYEETIQHINEREQKNKENRQSKFNNLKETIIKTHGFSEGEFRDICKYAGKGKIISFLSTINDMLSSESNKISKEEILNTIKEIETENYMLFWNYILLKRNSKKIKPNIVANVIEKGYARQYIYDHIPGISFVGYFDDVIGALKIGLDNGIFKGNIVYSTGNGEVKSDLAQKLIDAGLTKQ